MINKKISIYVYVPLFYFIVIQIILPILLTSVIDSSELLIKSLQQIQYEEMDSDLLVEYDESFKVKMDKNERLLSSEITYPVMGEAYGHVIMDNYGVKTELYYGDSFDSLKLGVGHYKGSVFPGEPGTTLIGGHNTSELFLLEKLEKGDTLSIVTSYGSYQYKITKKKIAKYDDIDVMNDLYKKKAQNDLIIYTCYPINMISTTDKRLFVYGELISGTMIDMDS